MKGRRIDDKRKLVFPNFCWIAWLPGVNLLCEQCFSFLLLILCFGVDCSMHLTIIKLLLGCHRGGIHRNVNCNWDSDYLVVFRFFYWLPTFNKRFIWMAFGLNIFMITMVTPLLLHATYFVKLCKLKISKKILFFFNFFLLLLSFHFCFWFVDQLPQLDKLLCIFSQYISFSSSFVWCLVCTVCALCTSICWRLFFNRISSLLFALFRIKKSLYCWETRSLSVSLSLFRFFMLVMHICGLLKAFAPS